MLLFNFVSYKENSHGEHISTPTISEILKEEFIEPCGLSADMVAKKIGIPASQIQDILHGRRQITVNTSSRLGQLFDVSERYFFNMQNDIDRRNIGE